jgi:long-subunit fatty acid transport protein
VRALAVIIVLCLSASALAYPLLAPRPVSSAIAGPADPHVAAIFYNPAALGPLRGFHAYLDGGARFHLGSITRAPEEGVSRGSASFSFTDPEGFAGFTWDLGTDSVTLGIGSYVPFSEISRFSTPLEYQEQSQKVITVTETLAAAAKVSRRFFFGAAVNVYETRADLAFARDTAVDAGSAGIEQPSVLCGGKACGLENPLARQNVRAKAFGGGVGFSLGLLGRPVDRVWLGLSYTSRPFGSGVLGFPLRGEGGARVSSPLGQTNADCLNDFACRGNVILSQSTPDFAQAALRIEISPRLEFESEIRYVHYGAKSEIGLTLDGGDLARLGAFRPPVLQTIDRGLQDAWGAEASMRIFAVDQLRLAPSIVVESSAVNRGAVSAAAIEATKLDAALTMEWRPSKSLFIGAHVGGTAYFLRDAGERFSPRAAATCVDAKFSLDACQAVVAGDALSSAAGRYTHFVVHVGASLGMDY